MPFSVLQELPFFKANRYPSRYGVMLGISLAVLGGLGANALTRTSRRWGRYVMAALGTVFLLENLSLPLPLSDLRVPGVYEAIAEEAGDFAVLEVPVAWRNGFRITGAQHVAFMFAQFYQTYHGKRLLNGNTSRNPELKFQYFAEMPVLRSLIALETGKELTPQTMAADREVAPALLQSLGVYYVVTHTPPVDEAILRYVEEVLPTRFLIEEAGIRIYRVLLSPTPTVVDLGFALAEGWGRRTSPAPAVRPRAGLLLPGAETQSRLTLSLRGLTAGDRVSVRMGDSLLGECLLGTEWSRCEITLPGSAEPVREVWLVAEGRHDPSEGSPGGAIGATGVKVPVDVYVRSAGEEFGDLGRIYVGGRDWSPNGRGYNLVALNPADASVLSAASFDTHADPDAGRAMAAYLMGLEPGTVVVAAVADEGSRLLTEEAVQALGTIGSAVDLRGCFRCAHAMVGVVGAAPGTAVEQWGVGVQEALVGRGLTEPSLYFELSRVELGAD